MSKHITRNIKINASNQYHITVCILYAIKYTIYLQWIFEHMYIVTTYNAKSWKVWWSFKMKAKHLKTKFYNLLGATYVE